MPLRVPAIDRVRLDAWCAEHLGSPPARQLFQAGYLSAVVGLGLEDGREAVVKVRPGSTRVAGCVEVHRRLFASGYPCPQPLTGVVPFGEHEATAETYVPGDAMLPLSGRSAQVFAAAFAWLIELAPHPDDVASLDPSPPWTAWSHEEGGLWPWPDDRDVDLNAIDGPAWVDDAGRRARDRLRAGATKDVVGHGDWYAGNLRWHGEQLLVVLDWDSVIADSEAALVGFAAAVYPTLRSGDEATVAETEEFIVAYQTARQRAFSGEELERCWAAGVWLRAFDAKKQHATNELVLSLTEAEARERLRRAGIRGRIP